MRWTKEEDDMLKQLHKEGYGNKDISEVIGRTPMAISARLCLLRKIKGSDLEYQRKSQRNSRTYNNIDPNYSDIEELKKSGYY